MNLKITSLNEVLFDWLVSDVYIPTEAWLVWILPNHMPLTSVVVPWILKFTPVEHNEAFVKSGQFIFDDEKINISVWRWLFFTDWWDVVVATSSATSSPAETNEMLEKMKNDVADKLSKLKEEWSIEEIEKAILEYEKITADIKLNTLRK